MNNKIFILVFCAAVIVVNVAAKAKISDYAYPDRQIQSVQDHLHRQKRFNSFDDLLGFFGVYQKATSATSATTTTAASITTPTVPGTICSCAGRIVKREASDRDDFQFRIVGGTYSKPHAYPQMCVLRYEKKMCACTIINQRHVMTAAHCVAGRDVIANYAILIGRDDLSDSTEPNAKVLGVTKVTVHPDYNKTALYSYDVAVVEVTPEITYNPDVKPTCLPLIAKNYTGLLAVVVGWGQTTEGGSISNKQKEAVVPVISREQCQKDYQGQFTIDESMMCAGYREGGVDPCGGDSGGPLFDNSTSPPTEVGVTSFGYGCARADKPGIYAIIDRVLNFIFANTKVSSGCQIYTHDTIQ